MSGSRDEAIRIWDILENESLFFPLCLLPNNQVACGDQYGSFSIWELNSLTKVKSFISNI